MKTLAILMCIATLTLGLSEAYFWDWARDFYRGSKDMWKAYRDLRESNHKDADLYFRARGNYEATNRGRGGHDAAAFWSKGKSAINKISGIDDEEATKDAIADRWGRIGGDPNRFRPEGLDPKY